MAHTSELTTLVSYGYSSAVVKNKLIYVRNPVYIFYIAAAFSLLLLVTLFADRPTLGPLERALFEVLYRLPTVLTPLAIGLTLLGSLVVPLLLGSFYLVKRRVDIALRVTAAGLLAAVATQLLSQLVNRPLPVDFLSNVSERANLPIVSFPSSYSAVSLTVGLMVAVYLPSRYRRWIMLGFGLVGAAQIFLGISLPLDVMAGWLIGIISYSVVLLALGSRYAPVDPQKLARKLTAAGLTVTKLKPAAVDARGSVPFFGEYSGGKLFVKVFNQDNNAADWLFKLARRVQYRRLEDEVPSLTPKRAIEHEAYLTMLATYKAKVRVPEFLGVYKVGSNSYAMALKRLSADGLDHLKAKQITDTMLDGIWRQIKKLHASHIIHKDLRAANVMIEKSTGLPWLIDFGFSESAISSKSFYKDNVEFIASSATKIGAHRAVLAASRNLGAKELAQALPYMQYAALSGATTTSLKQKPGLLDEIRNEMQHAAKLEHEAITTAHMRRSLRLKRSK